MELSGSITEKLTNESTKVKIREKLSLKLERVQKTFFTESVHGTMVRGIDESQKSKFESRKRNLKF